MPVEVFEAEEQVVLTASRPAAKENKTSDQDVQSMIKPIRCDHHTADLVISFKLKLNKKIFEHLMFLFVCFLN